MVYKKSHHKKYNGMRGLTKQLNGSVDSARGWLLYFVGLSYLIYLIRCVWVYLNNNHKQKVAINTEQINVTAMWLFL